MNEGVVKAVEVQDLEMPAISESRSLQVDEVLGGVGLRIEVGFPGQFVDEMARQVEDYGHYENRQHL